jgi:hypothetical protein
VLDLPRCGVEILTIIGLGYILSAKGVRNLRGTRGP